MIMVLRQQVMERDHYIYRDCGETGNIIHHVIPRALGGTDDIDNLKCKRCHNIAHNIVPSVTLDNGDIIGVATRCGNSSHVVLPKSLIGRVASVTLQ